MSHARTVEEAEVTEDYTVHGKMNKTSSHTAVATPMGILVLGGVNRKFKMARMLTSGARRPSQYGQVRRRRPTLVEGSIATVRNEEESP